VIGTFIRKAQKLTTIAAKNAAKAEKLLAKMDRIRARIDAKVKRLQDKDLQLTLEAHACDKTAKKLQEMFDIDG